MTIRTALTLSSIALVLAAAGAWLLDGSPTEASPATTDPARVAEPVEVSRPEGPTSPARPRPIDRSESLATEAPVPAPATPAAPSPERLGELRGWWMGEAMELQARLTSIYGAGKTPETESRAAELIEAFRTRTAGRLAGH